MIINKKEYRKIRKQINKIEEDKELFYKKLGFENEHQYFCSLHNQNQYPNLSSYFDIATKFNEQLSYLRTKMINYVDFKRIERTKIITRRGSQSFKHEALFFLSGKDKLIINDLNDNEIKIYIKKENYKTIKEFLNKNDDVYIDIDFKKLNYNDFIYIIKNNIDFVIIGNDYSETDYLRIIFNKEYYKLMEY